MKRFRTGIKASNFRFFWLQWHTALLLLSESLACAFGRFTLLCFVFFPFWLFELPKQAGFVFEIIYAVIFALGALYFAFQDFKHFKIPSIQTIRKRLERDNNLKHRLIREKNDQPAFHTGDAYWVMHQKKVQRAIHALRSSHSQKVMYHFDRHSLRFFALVAVFAGLHYSGAQSLERLRHGMFPFQINSGAKDSLDYLITLTPPEYTGLPVTSLSHTNAGKMLAIPEGTEIEAKVFSGFQTPTLKIGNRAEKFTPVESQNYELKTHIAPGAEIAVSQFLGVNARWPYAIIEDQPPSIALSEDNTLEILERGEFRIPIMVYDDYGVHQLKTHMTLSSLISDPPYGEPITDTRSIYSPAQEAQTIYPVYDFTAHSWAGLPVTLTFTVQDGAGQTHSVSQEIILPERHFRHPVARKLISLRKKLAWDFDGNVAPIATDLVFMLAFPEQFQNDPTVFLAIKVAGVRLHHDPSPDNKKSVIDLLWETALHLEDDRLSRASQKLRDAQQNLENALQNEFASPEELEQHADALEEALEDYLKALMQELSERMAELQNQNMENFDPSQTSQTLNSDALQDFMKELKNAMRDGETQTAQEMLSQLQRMMDTLQPSMSAPMPQELQNMINTAQEMNQLIKQQERLLEQTQQQHRQQQADADKNENGETGEQRESGAQDIAQSAMEQEALRQMLGQKMLEAGDFFGAIPESMGEAERAMKGAKDALDAKNPGGAIPNQQRALEQLKQAAQDLQNQFSQAMQQALQNDQGRLGMGLPFNLDPLGRPMQGNEGGMRIFPWATVDIPDEGKRHTIQDIQRILREKSGELSRPKQEREYFKRLLERF